jgi:hypothetical protein
VEYEVERIEDACRLTVKSFESRARIRGKDTRGGLETLSTVMVDLDYDGSVFDLDEVFFADAMRDQDWAAEFPSLLLGERMMVVFLDIFGNEAREVVERDQIRGGRPTPKALARRIRAKVPAKAPARKGRK